MRLTGIRTEGPSKRDFRRVPLILLVALSAAAQDPLPTPESTSSWKIQYLYDENDSTLTLTDLKFPSAQRGIASGILFKHKYNPLLGTRQAETPVVVVTANGGKKWTIIEVKALANSLFFLDDSTGWLVADDGIWATTESGRTWKRVSQVKDLTAVHFVSPARGFAVGSGKQALQTEDGGTTWKPIPAAAEPDTTKDWTVYNTISFAPDGKEGLITGYSRPPRKEKIPVWMNPEEGVHQPQVPNVTIFLETHDGGKTWSSQTASLFGEVIKESFSTTGVGLGLLEFHDQFAWPSEVYSINLRNGISDRSFRKRDRAITDLLCNPDGDSYLAGYESVGDIHPSPIPGKVKILHSSNLTDWTEMSIDYRAVARRVWLASPGGDAVWAATDTGMILQLQK